ncbi:MAG: helix-turn-helix domain-containing protein [Roseibium sp.]|uniref:helix-turn-helix transcriptional regulator n=1 Tax=Roseibium sp. TaxID=1936156 RepID=UPI001B229C93|nr:helix-turn-helix domain-containing protein [Roseibium sp.]MBO6893969.1 helix-turn-helix domain-containing protein [Roseibium sp.]MBO6932264.1 helix-turn-helix domain-containing protein [Roseibium sp.]
MQAATTTTNNSLMTEAAAADFLGVSIRTMQAWRVRGGGPRYAKMGKAVRYRPSDLEAFVTERLAASTSEVDSRS